MRNKKLRDQKQQEKELSSEDRIKIQHNFELFKEQVHNYEKKLADSFQFKFIKEEYEPSHDPQGLCYKMLFNNMENNVDLQLNLYTYGDLRHSLYLILIKYLDKDKKKYLYFTLDEYFYHHPELKFESKSLGTENFESLIKSYLENLDKAFNTYLKGHITGSNFVEYNFYYRLRN